MSSQEANGVWSRLDAWGRRLLWILGLLAILTGSIAAYALMNDRSCRNERRLDKVEDTLTQLNTKMTRVLTILENQE